MEILLLPSEIPTGSYVNLSLAHHVYTNKEEINLDMIR